MAANTTAFFPTFPIAIRWLSDATSLSPLRSVWPSVPRPGWRPWWPSASWSGGSRGGSGRTRATLLFAVFPGTFAFSLVYAEGIVVTCVALGLLALLARRWWLAGLLGLLATATSPIALAFVLSCAWCAGWAAWRDRSVRPLVAPSWRPWASSFTWAGCGGTPARSTLGA